MSIGLVLIGPPGVGKGTQAARLRDEFGLEHIATGDLLRDHCARGTALGRAASEHMNAGRLVPDDLVVAMVEERIEASPRFLLDGFPRTLAQAEALTEMLQRHDLTLTAAVFVDAPDEVVIDRIAGRRFARDRAAPPDRLPQEHRADHRLLRGARPAVPHRRGAAGRGGLRRGAPAAHGAGLSRRWRSSGR